MLEKIPIKLMLATAVVVCLLADRAQGDTILDDDMSSASYSSFFFSGSDSGANLNDISDASFSTSPTGGNPGAQLIAFHEHSILDEFDDQSVSLQSFFVEQSMAYNPGTQGFINDIQFAVDINYAIPFGNVQFDSIFFIVEDSMGGSAAGFASISPDDSGWQTITSDIFTNADFGSRDFAGNEDLNFGFGFTSSGFVEPGPETLTLGIDNFRVLANSAVPEPSSAALLAVAGAICLIGRRRR